MGKTRLTACLRSLKQLGLGAMIYAQDHRELMLPMLTSSVPNLGHSWWYSAIQPYVKNTQVLICPSDRNRHGHNRCLTTYRELAGCDYARRMATLRDPADRIMLLDSSNSRGCSVYGDYNSSTCRSFLYPRQNGGANRSLGDGHAERAKWAPRWDGGTTADTNKHWLYDTE